MLCMCTLCVLVCLGRSKEDAGSARTGVTNDCESPHGCSGRTANTLNCRAISAASRKVYFVTPFKIQRYTIQFIVLCVCVSVYLFMCMCCVSVCICMFLCMHVSLYMCLYVCLYACMYIYMCVHMCVCACMSIALTVCVSVCFCVCVFLCLSAYV